jgi:Leucine-rich repeat (LRR) protein
MKELKTLEVLILNNNKIKKLENMENLKNLRRLEIRGNRLQVLEGIKNLTQLEYITVSCNQITKILFDDLGEYSKLSEIGLFGNYLGDDSNLENNKKLFEELITILATKAPNLKVIYIGGNYFVHLGRYVNEYILGALKHISRIDGDIINK